MLRSVAASARCRSRAGARCWTTPGKYRRSGGNFPVGRCLSRIRNRLAPACFAFDSIQRRSLADDPGRLTDRFRVIAVILAAFDILRRYQAHLVAKRGEFAGPMVGATASLDCDLGHRQLLDEWNQLRAVEIGQYTGRSC